MKSKYLAYVLALGVSVLGCRRSSDYETANLVPRPVDISKVSIELVVDDSSSMCDKFSGLQKLESMKGTLNNLLGQFKYSNDKKHNLDVGVLALNAGELAPLNDFDYAKLQNAVDRIKCGGSTPIGYNLAKAERILDGNAKGTRNIFVLTDGMNNNSRSPEEVFNGITKTNSKYGDATTLLYLVAFDQGQGYYNVLSKMPNARVIYAKDTESLVKTVNDIGAELILEAPIQ